MPYVYNFVAIKRYIYIIFMLKWKYWCNWCQLMNIFSHRKEINVLKWRKTSPIIWGKKGFVSKMPFLLLSFLEKGPKLLVSFTTPPTHLPKDAVIESDHVFYPIFLNKTAKKEKRVLRSFGLWLQRAGRAAVARGVQIDFSWPSITTSPSIKHLSPNYRKLHFWNWKLHLNFTSKTL